MKKYLIITLLVGCTIPVVIAQQQNNTKTKREASEMRVEHYSHRRAESLKKELNLTDVQVNQIKTIYEKNAPVRLGMQSKDGVNITEMNQKEIQEVEKVLTPQQREKYSQYNQNIELQQKKKREDREMRSRNSVDEPRSELKSDLQKNK